MFFVPPRVRKSMKNRSKIASQCILNEESKTTPKMLQNRSNMAPKSPQVGAMLGSEAVLEPSKSEEKTTPKETPKKKPKKTPKRAKKPVNAWNGKRVCVRPLVDPEGDLQTCVCACVCMNLFVRPCWKSNNDLHENSNKNRSKINQKSIQNRPKIDPKSTKNHPEIYQKSTNNRPKIGLKSVQTRPRIDQKSSRNRLWSRPRFRDRSGVDFDAILDQTWSHLGGQNGAMSGPCWPKNWFLERPERTRKQTWFSAPLWSLLGTILGRFLIPKSTQNRFRIGLKSEEAKKTKMFKNH